MKRVDARGVLADQPFSYRAGKDGRVFVSWEGKQVKVLKGAAAQKVWAQLERVDEHEAQLLMARLTGNFKRGNERK